MRKTPIRALMAWVVMIGVGTVIASGSSPALATTSPTLTGTSPAAVCPPAFSIVPGAGGSASAPALNGVATLSGRDVWAVGATGINSFATLSEHWNGSSWTAVATPNTSRLNNALVDVTAVAPDDVWAVGSSSTSIGPDAR